MSISIQSSLVIHWLASIEKHLKKCVLSAQTKLEPYDLQKTTKEFYIYNALFLVYIF